MIAACGGDSGRLFQLAAGFAAPHIRFDRHLHGAAMPTLFRFTMILATIAGLVYGGMVLLVMVVQPRDREVTVRIPSERLNPPGAEPARPTP
jgi:hypothetical protein